MFKKTSEEAEELQTKKEKIHALIGHMELRKKVGFKPVCSFCKNYKNDTVFADCGHICCKNCFEQIKQGCILCKETQYDDDASSEQFYDSNFADESDTGEDYIHPGLTYYERFYGGTVVEYSELCGVGLFSSGAFVFILIVVYILLFCFL